MAKGFGGTPAEWVAAKRLAKRDLLPVVSNPHIQLGKVSKMKELGKTPSQVIETSDGPRCVGFSDWTAFEANLVNIENWAKNPDHGICMQTRLNRAIDIDVEDPELADRIEAFFFKRLGETAVRYRQGSARRILVYRAEGDVRRASFPVREWQDEDGKTKRELLELLGNGQQFVAAGMHKSGQRYEWRGGFPKPEDVQEVDQDDLEAAFEAAHAKFSCGDLRQAGRRDPTLHSDLDVADPVAEFLIANWPSYSCEHGKLYIDCPAKDLHSRDNGETETSWMLAGTGQFRNGHFVCLHQSCKEAVPNDDAFFRAVGYRAAQACEFDDVSDDEDAMRAYVALAPGASPKSKELRALAKLPLPMFDRDKNGGIEVSLANLCRGLRAVQACGHELAYDEFRGELVLRQPGTRWRAFTDADGVRLRLTLEGLGTKGGIGKELMRDALELIGDEHKIDLAVDWLEGLPPWDGESRISRFWPDYIGTKDTPYTRALGLYSWTAHAGRIMEPGCQVDMVPVMVSPEGHKKTSVVAAIAPGREFFAEFNLQIDDDKLARLMRGCLVGELAELRGVSARDGEAVKSWITRREEQWTPKFKEYKTLLRRRLVFYGTTNHEDFLKPHMGERRWLPVNVPGVIDLARIERDRDQLWAEAKAIWNIDGICWERVQELAKAERAEFREQHKWLEQVAAWLDDATDIEDGQTPRTTGVSAAQVLQECIGIMPSRVRKADEQDAGEALKACGMVRVQRWLDGRNQKVWVDASWIERSGRSPSGRRKHA